MFVASVERIALELRRAGERVVIQYPTRAASFRRLSGGTQDSLARRGFLHNTEEIAVRILKDDEVSARPVAPRVARRAKAK